MKKALNESATDPSHSFAPLEGQQVHTLILGTMPGRESLRMARYYAHPRNAFWPIMLAIISGNDADYSLAKTVDYETRCQLLTRNGYAAWDVLASCERPGSLDSRIVRSTERANDIASLVLRHPELKRIAFNGKSAEALFKRHVQSPDTTISLVALPSSSPAMASLNLAQKHQRWAEGLLG